MPHTSTAQEYNQWRMGGAGLDFNTEPPTYFQNALTNTRRPGWGNICDNKGNLKFYYTLQRSKPQDTEYAPTKDTIFNSAGEAIGSFSNVAGQETPIFFRYNDTLYYAFYNGVAVGETIDRYDKTNTTITHLYYSIINTQLNGGKGGVISPPTPALKSNYDISGISATQNADSTWWVTCRAGDSLYAVKVNSNTVLAPVGTYAKERKHEYVEGKFRFRGSYYQLSKFSHDGKTLVAYTRYEPFYLNQRPPFPIFNTVDSIDQTVLAVYQFNKQTGKFSGQQILKYQANNKYTESQNRMIYDSYVFSPNDSLLYVIHLDTAKLANNTSISRVLQYQRHSNSILSTEIEVYRTQNYSTHYNYIHLGQNGRILLSHYGSQNGYFAYIYRPNTIGKNCQIIHSGLAVKCYHPNNPTREINCFGLVNIFTRYHGNKMAFAFVPQCDSSVQMQNGCDTTKFTNYQWFIYGTAGNNHVDSAWGKAPKFKLPASGRYWVKLRGTTPSGYRPWYSDTIDFKILPVPKAKLSINSNTGCRYVAFEFIDSTTDGGGVHPQTGQTWVFNFGEGKDSTINLPAGQTPTGKFLHTYTQTGNYNVKVHYTNGYCADSFVFANNITIVDAPKPGITISDNNVCQPVIINFKRTYQDTITKITYSFDDGSVPITNNISMGVDFPKDHAFMQAGRYNVIQTLEGLTGCVTTDSIEINVLKGFEANQVFNLNYVTVEDSITARVDWKATDDAKLYEIYRSINKSNWQKIGSVNGLQKNEFKSQFINANSQQYFYKAIAYDTCGKSVESNLGSTILLKGKNFDNEFALVEWTPYESWRNGIERYEVQVEENTGWVPIIQLQPTNYKDYDFTSGDNLTKCYRVVAYENNSQASSTSNEICLRVAPMLWVPNAFTPNNDFLNDAFTVSALGIENLSIKIYNSSGAIIFASEDRDFAWDGTFKNQPVQEGVYFYTILAMGTNKKVQNLKGTITLTR
jgi:gliding motility-associated-like protein